MGTVGLNFGSPTSGTGFDVSTTVASIVSNLQNVETPWKNQLTTLQSQDTVISKLGSLFSTVSTDIGQLTDFDGVLAQKTGSSSDNNVLELTSASTSATAGTYTVVVNNLAQTSSGYLAPITDASDTLSGSITLQAGSGTAQTINLADLAQSDQNLAGLAAAINSSGAGVDASVLTDSSGSRLSLVSATSGADGNITVTANSIADATTSSGTLAYTSPVSGTDASLTVDGVTLSSSSNTVSNLIPGLTFQLLSASPQGSGDTPEPVQVVIANDNSGVESAVNQLVTDYNSLIAAVNTQEGNDSSGNPEPLYGSPTLSLLQQQLLDSLNTQNPNGYIDPVSSTAGTTLSGSMTIQVGSNTPETIVIGAGTSGDGTTFTGSGSGDNTLAGLVNAINSADLGVTADIATSNGESTLTLASALSGSTGALTVTSALSASTPTAVTFTDAGDYTDDTADNGTLGPLSNSGDRLSGSLTIQVGSGTAQTITLDSSDNTLTGLMDAINGMTGVSASLDQAGTGLTLTSGTVGGAGALTVTSNLYDTSNPKTADLNYNPSSDIESLTSLGIGLNDDGSMTFDASELDSVLNSDFSGVVGFFQSANSWGQAFSTMLTDAGSSSSNGILALAAQSNGNVESSLNTKITKENTQISTEQTQLTAELNQANEILEELPSQLNGMNELYSAVTGYNQGTSG